MGKYTEPACGAFQGIQGTGVRKPSRKGPELPQVVPVALPEVFQKCREGASG
jgi:hypothetical protein